MADDEVTAEEQRLLRSMNRDRRVTLTKPKQAVNTSVTSPAQPVSNAPNIKRPWATKQPHVDPELVKKAEERERQRELERQQLEEIERKSVLKSKNAEYSIDKFSIKNDGGFNITPEVSANLKSAPDDEELKREEERLIKTISGRGVTNLPTTVKSDLYNDKASTSSQALPSYGSNPSLSTHTSVTIPHVAALSPREKEITDKVMRAQLVREQAAKEKANNDKLRREKKPLSGHDVDHLKKLLEESKGDRDAIEVLVVLHRIVKNTFDNLEEVSFSRHEDFGSFISELVSVTAPMRSVPFPHAEPKDLSRDFDYKWFAKASSQFILFICQNIDIIHSLEERKSVLRSSNSLIKTGEEFIETVSKSSAWTDEISNRVGQWYALLHTVVTQLITLSKQREQEQESKDKLRRSVSETIIKISSLFQTLGENTSYNNDIIKNIDKTFSDLVNNTHLFVFINDNQNPTKEIQQTKEILQAAIQLTKKDGDTNENRVVLIMEVLLKLRDGML